MESGQATQTSELEHSLQAPDTKGIEVAGRELYDQAMQLKVVDAATLEIADSLLGAIKEKVESFKPGLDKKCEEAYGVHRFLTQLRAKVLKPFSDAENAIKKEMAGYHFAIEEKRRKEEARLAAIAQKEAEEKRKKEIADAKKVGDKEALAELKEAPIVPVMKSLPKTPEPPKLANTSFRDAGYGFQITNINLIPRRFLMVNEKAIQSVVDQLGSNHGIPGITVFKKAPTVAKRSA